MKNAFYIDSHGTRHNLQLFDDVADITQSVTLSRKVEIIKS